MRALLAFGRNDARIIRRDTLLVSMAVLPWLVVIGLRLIYPPPAGWLDSAYGLLAERLSPLVLSLFCLVQLPLLYGLIAGLLVLDDRDDGILTALRVTPLPVTYYVGYRLAIAAAASTLAAVLAPVLSGLLPLQALPALVPISLSAALFAPLVALFLAAFAGNKVEGMALSKGFGILMVGPLAAYFIDARWQVVLGVLPTYWPAKAFWVAVAGGNFWPYWAAGVVYHVILIAWLLRRFQARLRLSGSL